MQSDELVYLSHSVDWSMPMHLPACLSFFCFLPFPFLLASLPLFTSLTIPPFPFLFNSLSFFPSFPFSSTPFPSLVLSLPFPPRFAPSFLPSGFQLASSVKSWQRGFGEQRGRKGGRSKDKGRAAFPGTSLCLFGIWGAKGWREGEGEGCWEGRREGGRS